VLVVERQSEFEAMRTLFVAQDLVFIVKKGTSYVSKVNSDDFTFGVEIGAVSHLASVEVDTIVSLQVGVLPEKLSGVALRQLEKRAEHHVIVFDVEGV